MTIPKSIIATVLFILFTEIIAIWILLDFVIDIEFLMNRFYPLINGTIEILVIGLFLSKVDGFKNLTPNRSKPLYYLLAILLGATYTFIQTPLNMVYNGIFGTDFNIVYDFDLIRLKTWNSLATVFFLPIAEELFFRQYIQRRLQKKYSSTLTIILTAVLFAAIHLNFESTFLETVQFQPHGAYIAFFGGLISGILYHKSQSTAPSIIFHVIWNLVVIMT